MVTHTTGDSFENKDQAKLINNRQNGRRRGRGGQQVRNGQPNQDRGNRIDNRARGNAAQLLEKYKNMASEAQRQGDRVNTEYYLQFADHYFRVLSESRTRFEEQRPADQQRQPRQDYRDTFDQDGGDYESEGQRYDQNDGNWGDGDEDHQPPQQRQPERRPQARNDQPRADDQARYEQPRYEQRPAAGASDESGDTDAQPAQSYAQQPYAQPRAEGERRPRRARTPRANGDGHAAGSVATEPAERIEIDRLPQALAPAPVDGDAEPADAEEAPRRRRAPRRPRAEASAVEA